MKELADYLYDLELKYDVEIDGISVVNHINSYFARYGRDVICHLEGSEYYFAHYRNKEIYKDCTIREMNLNTVKSLIRHIRKYYETEAYTMRDWQGVKALVHQTVLARVVSIDIKMRKQVSTVYYKGETPYTLNFTTNRLPKEYLARLKPDACIPLYVAAADVDTEEGITIQANPYSPRIPEAVITNLLSEDDRKAGYIRCVLRKLGKFSRLVSDSIIDRFTVEEASKILGESLNVYRLSDKELEGLQTNKCFLKDFIRKARKRSKSGEKVRTHR
jgi:hypothetical protein